MPKFHPCVDPECPICRHNIAGKEPNSGHPVRSPFELILLAAAFAVGGAVIAMLVWVFLVFLFLGGQPK